nr:MAG: hypothetical protein [Gammatorquevirus sp.]
MPFWWGRRKRWWTNRRFTYKRRRNYRRKPRRRIFRRRHRRATGRRRRRRRTKVRRKRKYIKLLQWQPDSIRKCKIKGIETLVLGANGKQYRNYTTSMNEWTPPTTPTGGGFATSKYSLGYLYEQHQLHNNIWTHSNVNYDLCRYTGCKIDFYRHQTQDFIVVYQREYPMIINEDTYTETHPHSMLLQQHKIVIPSMKTRPFGKKKIRKKIRPPKQQTNKWFFQHSFTDTGLLFIKAAACDLNYIHLGEYSENELTSFLALNIESFYVQAGWGHSQKGAYKPISTMTVTSVTGIGYDNKPFTVNVTDNYKASINYDTGFFASPILRSKSISKPDSLATKKPLIGCRYNPKIDTGEGNYVWLIAVQQQDYRKPSSDKTLIAHGKPMWLLLYGWTDYVLRLKKGQDIYTQYYLALQSPQIRSTQGQTQNKTYIPIDDTFVQGNGPYNATPTSKQKEYWYPTLEHQQQTLNNIVKCGPFIPRPEGKKSNWELHINYCFYFKWGGALDTNHQVADPSKQTDYPVPDNLNQALQIVDPQTQIPASMLHTWDYRRGFITQKALKRMQSYLPMEPTLSTDSECSSPLKKRRLSKREPPLQEEETETDHCLQQLFEQSSCQEIQEEKENPIYKLIQQQQQQQHVIKYNLLQLLTALKKTQLQMQLHTGILE